MDYNELRRQYMEAKQLMYDALLHVMKNLPQQCDMVDGDNTINFEDSESYPTILLEDPFLGGLNRIVVDRLTLVGEKMYFDGYCEEPDNGATFEDVPICFNDGETCKEILDAIDDEVMSQIKPFRPQSQIA